MGEDRKHGRQKTGESEQDPEARGALGRCWTEPSRVDGGEPSCFVPAALFVGCKGVRLGTRAHCWGYLEFSTTQEKGARKIIMGGRSRYGAGCTAGVVGYIHDAIQRHLSLSIWTKSPGTVPR